MTADSMLYTDQEYSHIQAVLYLDTDAIITVNYSMTHVISFIIKDLNWNISHIPFSFNQDGPGWSCRMTMSTAYNYCLNSGTVLWFKSDISTRILQDWWNSAGDPYDISKFQMKWRQHWPWEQAQMYVIYERYCGHIIRLSFPSLPYLPWTSNKNPKSQYPTDFVEPWCLSHWPGANCFITHHCASSRQKAKLLQINFWNSVYTKHLNPINSSRWDQEMKIYYLS